MFPIEKKVVIMGHYDKTKQGSGLKSITNSSGGNHHLTLVHYIHIYLPPIMEITTGESKKRRILIFIP